MSPIPSLFDLSGRIAVVAGAAASLCLCPLIFAAPVGVDLSAAEAAVRNTDADWAAAANTAGVEAWMSFYSADAIVRLPNDRLVSGNEQIRDAVTHLLTLPRLSVAWHPIKVEVTRSGDAAYLTGAYELRFGDSHGMPLSERGRLLEFWRKQADGSWKCVVETWTSDDAQSAVPAAPIAHPAPPPPPALPGSESHAASSVNPAAQGLAAQYGDMPIHYEEAIRQYFQEHMTDPDSIQYREITKPEKGYTTGIAGTVLMHETRDYGWKVKATINTKNSHGRYVGFKSYTFLFHGENIVHTLAPM
jgi:ketosteroid isomerase-like protein